MHDGNAVANDACWVIQDLAFIKGLGCRTKPPSRFRRDYRLIMHDSTRDHLLLKTNMDYPNTLKY
jgi:hypothetical protein